MFKMRSWHEGVLIAVACAMTSGPAAASQGPGGGGHPAATDVEFVASDGDVTKAVERELFGDEAVPVDELDISTTGGVVTLSGRVDNLLARDRAVSVAQAVKGVRAVVDEIRVEPTRLRTDGVIDRDVREALLTDPATDAYEIVVAVQDGVVTLTGVVDSWAERTLAVRRAKGVKGVRDVNAVLSIDVARDRADAEVAADVRAALHWDQFVDDGLIIATVDDGNVTLRGTVGSAAERTRAFADAWVRGVRSVDTDGLEVAYWTRNDDLRSDKYAEKPDAAIAAAIEDALILEPRVLSTTISPEVDDGVVTRRGVVSNAAARRAAVAAAQNTVGVRRVFDHLQVRPGPAIGDGTLEEQVRDALARDPYVERHDVHVTVWGGDVTLSGTVDSLFEKAQAEDVAGALRGVADVRNYLIVANPRGLRTLPSQSSLESSTGYEWYSPSPYSYAWYRPSVWTPADDQEIAEDIRRELWWSPFVDSDDISIAVEDGVARLTGTVATHAERRVASENAIEGGAISVDNQLTVEFLPPDDSD